MRTEHQFSSVVRQEGKLNADPRFSPTSIKPINTTQMLFFTKPGEYQAGDPLADNKQLTFGREETILPKGEEVDEAFDEENLDEGAPQSSRITEQAVN
jgi:hypothetical protein